MLTFKYATSALQGDTNLSSVIHTMAQNITTSTHAGWQNQPDGRGTFDILKTCFATVFLTCWTNVCPNVPPLNRRLGTTMGRLQLFLLSLIGPDFVLSLAAGQLYRAWEDRKILQNYPQKWTLRACFFVNMGGLHIEFPQPDSTGQRSMPINCKQLNYLVDNDYLKISDIEITGKDIEARNKVDGIGRGISAVQALWFVVNTIGRVAQGLHITTLELTTLATVFIMVLSSLTLWRKPMDVSQPIFIECTTKLDTIIWDAWIRHGLQGSQYGRTPLSFLDRKEWFVTRTWESYIQILRKIFLVKPRLDRQYSFASVDFFDAGATWEWMVGFGMWILLYSAVFMGAWNNYFPTDAERVLWRISSIICLSYGILGAALAFIDYNRERMRMWWNNGSHVETKNPAEHRSVQLPKWVARIRNLSPDNDPQWEISLSIWIPITVLSVIYSFSRAFILFEDLYGLRLQPESAFQTVDWNQYSPLF